MLRVERAEDHITLLELRGPPDNYLDVELATAIADALEAADTDPTCRAIVLASEGKHFCAGARLRPIAPEPDAATTDRSQPVAGGEQPPNPLYAQVARMFGGEVPIVAAVQGAAIGAGLGLALIADFRVAAPEARFGATFAKLGFHHGFGLSATLPRLVGQQAALDLLYSGRRVPGEEARRLGLCDRLVPVDRVREEAMAMAREIATSAPLAVRAIRRTMRGDLPEAVRRATIVEDAAQQVLMHTDDFREGVTATAERRAPRFTGH